MHKLFRLAILSCMFMVSFFCAHNLLATSPNVVISQIKAGNKSSDRLIEIYNNSANSVDITGWCLLYRPPNVTSGFIKIGCFSKGETTSARSFIKPYSYALVAPTKLGVEFEYDIPIDVGVGLGDGLKGSVYLVNRYDSASSIGDVVDMVG